MHAIIRQKLDDLVRRGEPVKESKHWGETSDKRGHFAHFDLPAGVRATIFSHDNAGAFIVQGAIHRKYVELGYERGFLGYPVADEAKLKTAAHHYIGQISRFQGGSIVWCHSDQSIGVYRADGTLVAGQSHGYAADLSTVLAVPNQTSMQLEAVGRTVALLIETIALQQNQLVNLSEELNAVSLLRIQTEISEQASKHLYGALDKAAATLKSTGGSGQVAVGATTHKGALRLVRDSEVTVQRDSTRDEIRSNASSVEAKLRTAIGLFNSTAGLNVDTQQTSALIEKASEKTRHVRAEEAVGTFEIRHGAITCRIG